jgi:hypothetical protein
MSGVFSADGLLKTGSFVSRSSKDYRHTGGSGLEIWYGNFITATALTTGAPAIGTLRAFPYIAPTRGGTLDRIAFTVTTLLAGNARVGIYNSTSEQNIYPSTLVVDGGDFSTATATVKSTTISVNLVPSRLYWLVHLCGTGAATLRAVGLTSAPNIGLNNTLPTTPNVGISVAQAYGALPATFPAGGTAITAVPIPLIAVRFSA